MDEAQQLCGAILESLDHEQDAKSLARHAYRSHTQFYPVFRSMIEETPAAHLPDYLDDFDWMPALKAAGVLPGVSLMALPRFGP